MCVRHMSTCRGDLARRLVTMAGLRESLRGAKSRARCPKCPLRDLCALGTRYRPINWLFAAELALDLWSHGCVCSVQHHHAGGDMVEVVLGWTSGATVSDYDINSKIRARHYLRNHRGYNRSRLTEGIGRSARPSGGRPKTTPCHPPTPPYCV